jgi:hypothetical protein
MGCGVGMMFIRGVGELPPMISEGYGALGTIGTIGTMFSTYTRERGCGGLSGLPLMAWKTRSVFLRVTLKRSSLSSLSSLKGCFTFDFQGFGGFGFSENIVPEKGVIVPIVPRKTTAAQDVVAVLAWSTKYSNEARA